MIQTGNHDNWRVSDRYGPDFTDAINMMLLTLPGTPTTYNGEEIGLANGNYTGLIPRDPFANISGNWVTTIMNLFIPTYKTYPLEIQRTIKYSGKTGPPKLKIIRLGCIEPIYQN